MNPLVIELPLPPRHLSPNGRAYWRAKAQAVAEYRGDVHLLAEVAVREKKWQAPDRVAVSLVWCLKGARTAGLYAPLDADNAVGGAKTLLDGLRDAKALVNDTWEHMKIAEVDVDLKSGPYVRVTLTPA